MFFWKISRVASRLRRWVVKTDVDSRRKGLVKHANAVGGENEYARVILHDAEEYCGDVNGIVG